MRLITNPGPIRRGVIWCLVCFAGAICFSKAYWGYFLWPPAPPLLGNEIEAVEQWHPLLISKKSDGSGYEYAIAPTDTVHNRLAIRAPRSSTEDASSQEFLQLVSDRIQLPNEFIGTYYSGDAVLGTTANDTQLLYVTILGQHTNDHYGHLELVFDLQSDAPPRRTYYEYDLAGIEGLHWFAMFLLMSCGLLFLAGMHLFQRILTRGLKPAT